MDVVMRLAKKHRGVKVINEATEADAEAATGDGTEVWYDEKYDEWHHEWQPGYVR